jgi:hypothetical protein
LGRLVQTRLKRALRQFIMGFPQVDLQPDRLQLRERNSGSSVTAFTQLGDP